jgi:putative ABC transport system permease protein
MTPHWRLSAAIAIQTLRANPLHTALSTLGIIIGVGALVAILALGDGMERFARDQIESTTDLQAISVQTRTTERLGDVLVRRTDAPVLTAADAGALRGVIGASGQVALHASAGVELRVPGDTARTGVLVRGTLADAADIGDLAMVAGRFFSSDDVAAAAHVAVLDRTLAARLGADASAAVGGRVLLGGAEMRVVGVVESARGGPPTAYVPLTAIGATSPTAAERVPTLTVLAQRVEDVPALRARVERWLAQRFGARATDFSVITNEARVVQAQRGILLFKLVMGAITGISIVVGGIGVMNVLLVSIVERTREIGIRKATGARRRDIAVQFLTESVTISGFGSVLGVVVGLSAVFAFAPVVRTIVDAPFQPAITWASVAVALAAAVVVGVLFGTYPALRAARLAPADAIRHET